LTIYQWTTDDEVALNAIIVGIGDDNAALIEAGATPPLEPTASIYWPEWISQGDKIKASLEGPYSVPEALERADELCALWRLQSRCYRYRRQGIVAARMGKAGGSRGAGLIFLRTIPWNYFRFTLQ
jgi:hypothetical protein